MPGILGAASFGRRRVDALPIGRVIERLRLLSDGVLEFKRKWGAHVRRVRQEAYLAVGRPTWTPALRGFFGRHPLVAEVEDGEFLACTPPDALASPPSAAARGMFEIGGLAGALVPDEGGCWRRVPLMVASGG